MAIQRISFKKTNHAIRWIAIYLVRDSVILSSNNRSQELKTNAVLVPLRMFSLKRSTAGAFVVPFKVNEPKSYNREQQSEQGIRCCFRIATSHW